MLILDLAEIFQKIYYGEKRKVLRKWSLLIVEEDDQWSNF
jgi:hypothetical protein